MSFNFGSRTFAFLSLAQSLNRSASAFTSVVREYLDPLVKADRCAQYVDDIGIAANTPDELIENLELVFQQLSKAGLKLSMNKCEFDQQQIEYLGKSISSTGIAPIEKRITDYLKKLKPPTSVKALQRYLGFVNFYRSYIPRLADKTAVLHELIKKDTTFKLEQRHKDVIFDINESLLKATKLSLKLPLPEKQLVIMCDASEHAAGYVLLIEDYSETQSGSLKKYAPVAFGSKKFQGGQMSLTMYAKEFLAMHFAFDEFGHILWGAKKPIIVKTDNKALTRFFQAKHIPPSLWNFCDQTLHSVNLMSTLFQKLHKNRKRLENVNGVLYRIFYDHTGLESHKPIVVPDQVMLEIVRSLHSNPVQGHPGSKTMLHELRKRYYSPSLAEKNTKGTRKL